MNNYNLETVYRKESGEIYSPFHFNMTWDDVCEIVGQNPDEVVSISVEQKEVDLEIVQPNSGMRKIEQIYREQCEEIERLKLEVESLKGLRVANKLLEKSIIARRKRHGKTIKRKVELYKENQGLKNELETIETLLKTLHPETATNVELAKEHLNGLFGKLVQVDVDSFAFDSDMAYKEDGK